MAQVGKQSSDSMFRKLSAELGKIERRLGYEPGRPVRGPVGPLQLPARRQQVIYAMERLTA